MANRLESPPVVRHVPNACGGGAGFICQRPATPSRTRDPFSTESPWQAGIPRCWTRTSPAGPSVWDPRHARTSFRRTLTRASTRQGPSVGAGKPEVSRNSKVRPFPSWRLVAIPHDRASLGGGSVGARPQADGPTRHPGARNPTIERRWCSPFATAKFRMVDRTWGVGRSRVLA